MGERVKGLVITLDQDYHIEEVRAITDAIKMIKGVLSVDNVPKNVEDHINRRRVTFEISEKLYETLHGNNSRI